MSKAELEGWERELLGCATIEEYDRQKQEAARETRVTALAAAVRRVTTNHFDADCKHIAVIKEHEVLKQLREMGVDISALEDGELRSAMYVNGWEKWPRGYEKDTRA